MPAMRELICVERLVLIGQSTGGRRAGGGEEQQQQQQQSEGAGGGDIKKQKKQKQSGNDPRVNNSCAVGPFVKDERLACA